MVSRDLACWCFSAHTLDVYNKMSTVRVRKKQVSIVLPFLLYCRFVAGPGVPHDLETCEAEISTDTMRYQSTAHKVFGASIRSIWTVSEHDQECKLLHGLQEIKRPSFLI